MSTEETKAASIGRWKSISTEIRPSSTKTAEGKTTLFYLARSFELLPGDVFELVVTNYADPYGKVAIAKMDIRGHIEWRGEHGVAPGAQKVDFTADEAYRVTPLVPGFAEILNKYTRGFEEWRVAGTQSILKRAFPPFGLADGQVFREYDLIYVLDKFMFWGARHMDGRGFDTEANRPDTLQIPMVKVG
jgi:hypothetical protein